MKDNEKVIRTLVEYKNGFCMVLSKNRSIKILNAKRTMDILLSEEECEEIEKIKYIDSKELGKKYFIN